MKGFYDSLYVSEAEFSHFTTESFTTVLYKTFISRYKILFTNVKILSNLNALFPQTV